MSFSDWLLENCNVDTLTRLHNLVKDPNTTKEGLDIVKDKVNELKPTLDKENDGQNTGTSFYANVILDKIKQHPNYQA